MSKKYHVGFYYFFFLIIVLSMTACGGGKKKGGGGGVYIPPARRTLTDQPFAVHSHKSTKLKNGDLLITGGFINGAAADDAYAYDSDVTNRFYDVDQASIRNDLAKRRALHAQALVEGLGSTYAANGSVLITGGETGLGLTRSAEVYDPIFDKFSVVGDLNYARKNHTVTEIQGSGTILDGKFLVVGGTGTNGLLPWAELFDPSTGTFSVVGSPLNIPRENHSATRLYDGRILIAGGATQNGATNRAEIFNVSGPQALSFTLLSSVMSENRVYHTATYLDNKTGGLASDDAVLLAGGVDSQGFALDNADFYDPFFDQFVQVGSVMQEPIFHHTATALPAYDIHDVILMGGFTNLNFFNSLLSNPTEQVELFTYSYNGGPSGFFTRTTLDMLQRRALHTSDVARNTTLAVIGGVDGNGNAHLYGEEYDH